MFGRHHFALKMVLIFSLMAVMGPSHAWGLSLDSKAQGLAHYIVGVCHDLNGEVPEAVSEYQKSVQWNGFEIAPRLKLGAYFLRLDQVSEAALQLKAVERIDPANTDVYLDLGQLYYAQSKYPQAIEQFLKILHFDPSNTSALFLLGSVYADSNENPKSIEIFRHVLDIEPENAEALNSLGYLYAQSGIHLDEAIRMINKAITLDSTNGAYYDSLGWALYKKRMFSQALMALQKAESYIEDEILYDHLGDVYKALNKIPWARTYWRKSLDINPHQPLVRQKMNGS